MVRYLLHLTKSVRRRARDRRYRWLWKLLLRLTRREVAAQDLAPERLAPEPLVVVGEAAVLLVAVAQVLERRAAAVRLKVGEVDVAVGEPEILKSARRFDVRGAILRSLPALRRST